MDITALIGLQPERFVKQTFLNNHRNNVSKTVVSFIKFELDDENRKVKSYYEVEQFNSVNGEDVLINRFKSFYFGETENYVDYSGNQVTDLSIEEKISEYDYFFFIRKVK